MIELVHVEWDLTGIPCCHVVSAIQSIYQNPIDYVAHWYNRDTYLKTYSHTLEVLNGEDFWEFTDSDIMGPPPIPKKLRGRPPRLRRREGWEDKGNHGPLKRVSRVGRKMHCSICRKSDHRKN